MITIHIEMTWQNGDMRQMIRERPSDMPYRKAIAGICSICGLLRPSGKFTGTIDQTLQRSDHGGIVMANRCTKVRDYRSMLSRGNGFTMFVQQPTELDTDRICQHDVSPLVVVAALISVDRLVDFRE